MEAAYYSGTSVSSYKTIRSQNAEDHNMKNCRSGNLKICDMRNNQSNKLVSYEMHHGILRGGSPPFYTTGSEIIVQLFCEVRYNARSLSSVQRIPWTGDQPAARPLTTMDKAKHRKSQTDFRA
ncbi:uncharacterized protein LOC111864398 [Cryptotermes secundus]|uniref:uncharacterized protein LOC111864398 n=1 Tax=Cryptotermes secundus TaxID=105785 RepID=UPI000CD7B8A5|nr:uncharacterized protein LOC111864398 [Cryptotermes secundus]